MGIGYGSDRPSLHKNGGVTRINVVIGDPPRHYAARSCHRALAKDGSRIKNAFRAGPCATRQAYRCNHQSKVWITPVMIAGAEVGALRDADIIAELHGGEIIDPTVLANPAIVAYFKMPRVLDRDSRFNDHSIANSGTKKAQEGYAPGRSHPGNPVQRQSDKQPSYAPHNRASWVVPGVVIRS